MTLIDQTHSDAVRPNAGAGRMIDVLLTFAKDSADTLGVSEVARALKASKATVYRDLQTLLSRGLVEYDDRSRRYRLGTAAVVLGARANQESTLLKATRGMLEALSFRTGESVALSMRVGWERATIDSVFGQHESGVKHRIGRLYPLHAGASGKSILAFLGESQIRAFLANRLEHITEATITDPNELRRELEIIRREGVASSEGERLRGSVSLASPIFNAQDEPIGSISINAPIERADPVLAQKWAKSLTEATNEVSRRLHEEV